MPGGYVQHERRIVVHELRGGLLQPKHSKHIQYRVLELRCRKVRLEHGALDCRLLGAVRCWILWIKHCADNCHLQWRVHSWSVGRGGRDICGLQRPLQRRLLLRCSGNVRHRRAMPRWQIRRHHGPVHRRLHRPLLRGLLLPRGVHQRHADRVRGGHVQPKHGQHVLHRVPILRRGQVRRHRGHDRRRLHRRVHGGLLLPRGLLLCHAIRMPCGRVQRERRRERPGLLHRVRRGHLQRQRRLQLVRRLRRLLHERRVHHVLRVHGHRLLDD